MSKIQNCIILSDELSEELWHLTQSILNNVVDYFTNNWLSPKPFDSNFTFPNGISQMIWPLSSSIHTTVPWFTLSLPDFRPTEDPKGCYSYLINNYCLPYHSKFTSPSSIPLIILYHILRTTVYFTIVTVYFWYLQIEEPEQSSLF